MAELPATMPAEAAPERDRLMATKLHVPRPRPGFLARPRLLELLTEGMARELTLVCAPAGFGKTTLLGEWARHSRGPVAWLSLDAADSDPARFWRYVAAALDGARPGIHQQVAVLLQGAEQPRLEAVVTAVVNELAGRSDGLVLVLDDYHLVDALPVHESLAVLLERLPPGLRLTVASRADPPLPLARLRASGQLTEVRAADLRFTPEEAAELLRSAVGADLPEVAMATLGDRTEGWVAGLQLAALSLRGHHDIDAFVQGFSGSHRYIVDYLAAEVLDRQPDELRRFLLETSILERLSGPLCDVVTGRDDSQRLLVQVERASLFLHPLDEVRGWWRYHQLFADLLRARLRQEQPQRVPELHRAAAAWCEDHGLVEEAVGYALAAGDTERAVSLVDRDAQALLERGEGATLHRWLAALPPELVDARPRLCLAQAITTLIAVRVDEAEALLTKAERAFAAHPPAPPPGGTPRGLGNVPGMLAMLRAELARARGQADRAMGYARQGLAAADEHDRYLRYFLRWNLAVGDLLQGRVAEAEAALGELAADPWAGGSHRYFTVRVLYTIGQAQRAQGRLGAALGSCQRALELAGEPGGRVAVPMAGVALVGLAEVLRERNQLDEALRHATDGVGLCRQLAYGQWLGLGLTVLAWVRHAVGDRAGTLAAIAEAERAVPDREAIADLILPLAVQRARLWLANGEVAEAAHWVDRRGLGPDDEPSFAREREYLILARVLLATRASERALGLLERLAALAAAQGRTGSLIQVRVLQALTHAACGQEQPALAALAEALTLAAPEGWLRVFVDEGPPLADLLRRLLAGQRAGADKATETIPRDHLTRLAAAFEQAGAPALPAARRGAVVVPGLVEPLSARELQVLELLAAGLPNRAIAEELVVTLDTVKSHVSNLFAKLGTTNRTQAVARARALGLVR
jgi:LuxR family transcriptional regulator, maltose regulon positive regulatory protein